MCCDGWHDKPQPGDEVTECTEDGFDASTICKVLKNKIRHHRGLQWANV